ncbi:MAG: hypothetical protein F7B18_00625 [Desulfurococcales archaeon]|nr:hypothetical protein [Desulfurococcales archaeon]
MDIADCIGDGKHLRVASTLCKLELERCLEWGGVRAAVAWGCGRRMVLLGPQDGDMEVFLREAASGNVPWVRGCRLGAGLEVEGYGLRGILARGEGVVVKLLAFAVEDNPEYVVLSYLSRVEPGLVPQPVCSMSVDGVQVGIATRAIEGEPLAVEFISSAFRDVEPPSLEDLALGVARLHRALYGCVEDWCRPRPVSREDVEEWSERLRWRAKLLRRIATPDDLGLVEALDSMDELASLMARSYRGIIEAPAIRIHGDLHLYQVYRSPRGLVFTDFEGEPYREPARRDVLEPPARDIATLIRSIDYASALALMERGMDAGEAALEASRGMRGWREAVSRRLLKAYLKALGEDPLAEGDWESGLAFWVAERASYELVYDIIEGTGLHHIPLNAILRIRDSWPRVAW